MVIDYISQNSNNFVPLVHQFKIFNMPLYKPSGNRLHEPGNQLPVQKDISELILTLIKEF